MELTGPASLNDRKTTSTTFPHAFRTRTSAPVPNRITSSSPQHTLQHCPSTPQVPFSISFTDEQDSHITPNHQYTPQTAIVIKRIPLDFYQKEDFVTTIFPQLGLVPPYFFKYYRWTGGDVIYGVAFAYFYAAKEARAAVDKLNNYELQGGQLRVEFKRRNLVNQEQRQQPPEDK